MTNEEKKLYLSRYKSLDRQIEALINERSRWLSRAENMTVTKRKTSGVSDRARRCLEHISLLEAEINEAIDHMITLRGNIWQRISGMDDERLQEVLYYRYIEGLTLEGVAAAMHYSYMQVNRLINRALETLPL